MPRLQQIAGHVQHQQRLHAVVRERDPNLGAGEIEQTTRVAEESAVRAQGVSVSPSPAFAILSGQHWNKPKRNARGLNHPSLPLMGRVDRPKVETGGVAAPPFRHCGHSTQDRFLGAVFLRLVAALSGPGRERLPAFAADLAQHAMDGGHDLIRQIRA